MGKEIECSICVVNFDDLGKVNEIVQDFANNKLRCEINGKKIGNISEIIIQEKYPHWGGEKKRIEVIAVVSLYKR